MTNSDQNHNPHYTHKGGFLKFPTGVYIKDSAISRFRTEVDGVTIYTEDGESRSFSGEHHEAALKALSELTEELLLRPEKQKQ